MQRKFLSGLGLILLLNILIKPVYIFGIDAEVQNRVGQEVYGMYFALLNLSFFFNIVIDFGISNFNNRNIAQNTQLLGKHFRKLFTLKALLALAYAAITALLALALDYRGEWLHMLAWIVLNQVLVSFILFIRGNLTGMHYFKRDSVVSIMDRALLIAGMGWLLYGGLGGGTFHIMWFVYVQSVAYAITFIVALLLLGTAKVQLRWSYDWVFSIHIFRKSLPYALFMLSGMLYTRVDAVMLEKLLPQGAYHAGVYAQGFRFYDAAGMFAWLFGSMLVPVYARMLKERLPIAPMVGLGARLLLGTVVAGAIFFTFFPGWLLEWRYTDVSSDSVRAFSALMWALVGWGMFYIYGSLMTANEDLRALNFISVGGLVLNLLLNFVLIPKYMAFGAALTTMVTQVFAGGAMLLYTVRHFRLSANGTLVRQFALFAGLYAGACLGAKHVAAAHAEWLSLVLGAMLMVGSGLVTPGLLLRLYREQSA
jgi:O-antigen/teichoic acid export membrane protein